MSGSECELAAAVRAEASAAAADAMKKRAAASPHVRSYDAWRALVDCASLGLAPLARADVTARKALPANRLAASLPSASASAGAAAAALRSAAAAVTGASSCAGAGGASDTPPSTPSEFERAWRKQASVPAAARLAWLARLGQARLRALWRAPAGGGGGLACDGALLSGLLATAHEAVVAAAAVTGEEGALQAVVGVGTAPSCGAACAARVLAAVAGGARWPLAVAMLAPADKAAVAAVAEALRCCSGGSGGAACASCGESAGDSEARSAAADDLLTVFGCEVTLP